MLPRSNLIGHNKLQDTQSLTKSMSSVVSMNDAISERNVQCYGLKWMNAFGIVKSVREKQHTRYTNLKERLSPQNCPDIKDPKSDTLEDNSDEIEIGTDDIATRKSCELHSNEQLLYEINTDLNRLYPTGNETFFQCNKTYLDLLRNVLFIWCRLHSDVSYRQGMHDVAAVVLYSFLIPSPCQREFADKVHEEHLSGDSENSREDSSMNVAEKGDKVWTREALDTSPIDIIDLEVNTYLTFESIMVYMKPFYYIQSKSHQPLRSNNNDTNQKTSPSLETEVAHSIQSLQETETNSAIFADALSEEEKDENKENLFETSEKPFPTFIEKESQAGQLPLHKLCNHIQYELLQRTDPQLFYHLRNLEIIPITYCLRWVRLLLAREFTLDQVLKIWDAFILDDTRPPIQSWPDSIAIDTLRLDASNNQDTSWLGFPLLRYVCVAKLLKLSPRLREKDNTGCLRLLMHTHAEDDDISAHALIKLAKRLQNPMIEASLTNAPHEDTIDVVCFDEGSLGIILTATQKPHSHRLAVKGFTEGHYPQNLGQAEASGKVKVGDLLESVNGVSMENISTEEIKRHLELVGRPVYIAFRHLADPEITFFDDLVIEPKEEISILSSNQQATAELKPHLLPGEMCYAHVRAGIKHSTLTNQGIFLSHYEPGKIFVTNYRCCFLQAISNHRVGWQVPVLSIISLKSAEKPTPTSRSGTAFGHAQAVLGFSTTEASSLKIIIRCKDSQIGRFLLEDEAEYSKIMKCLNYLAFPSNLLDAFCFSYVPKVAPSDLAPFDIRHDYQRIGLLDVPERLRCIDQTAQYELCKTYPQHLVVPVDLSDQKIKSAASFRSLNRLPVVSWMHPGNKATICRSSQPMVGLKSTRCNQDEQLVRLLCSTDASSKYVIMDARSQLAAVGNKAMGKGTELSSNYRGSTITFMNIENIHTMRQSFDALVSIFNAQKDTGSVSMYGQIEASGWLRHVRLILKASLEIAQHVHGGVSVLTHCSDGWDRTSKMVSIAELMLDPFYRTFKGFQVLIEKEWCSFGHPFATRYGHGRSDTSNDQRSPIFLMFLDCVWQLLRQYPTFFEFTDKFLVALADHVHSCKYGTFLMDCEKQRCAFVCVVTHRILIFTVYRKELLSKYRVCPVWSELNGHNEQFVNPLYSSSQEAPGFLAPNTFSKNIK